MEAQQPQQQPQQPQQGTMIHTTITLSQARIVPAATSSGELVFFGGGGLTPNNPSDRVDIYNVTSGSWTTATLSVARGLFTAVSSQNLVFFAGGTDSIATNVVYDQVDIYNISNGSWSTATLSQPRFGLAATSVGNLVLFGGGYNSNGPSNVVDVFDVTNNTWTNATLSQARSDLAATSVDNRYALFGGGYNGSGLSNVVDIFDLLNGMWNTTTLSQPRSDLTATSLGNLAFFGGGQTTGKQPSNVVDIFNSTSQTWSTATLSQARYQLAASSIGEIVAFGGGSPDGSTFHSIVDMLSVTSNTWFTLTLSQPRCWLASTTSTNKIFFGGGLSSNGFSDVVDIFEISVSPPILLAVLLSVFGGLLFVAIVILVIMFVLKKKRQIEMKKKKERQYCENNGTSMIQQQKKESVAIESARTTIGSLNETNQNTSHEPRLSTTDPLVLQRSQISFSTLTLEKKIGIGGYGEVWLGKWNSASVALKFCKKKEEIDDFMREIRVMIALPPHPNVVQLFGVSLDGPQPVIVLEYCAGGSLDKLLFDSKVNLSEEYKIQLIKGIAAGMYHLHKHNIVHRDLAARNILLTANGEPKISDFGMSRILERTEEGTTKSGIGPICWMAPESIRHRNYSKKSDIWSFGIVVYELVAQREPHKDKDVFDVGVKIRDEGLTPEIPSNCPEKLRELMLMCWKIEPEQRPDFEKICAVLENSGVMRTSVF